MRIIKLLFCFMFLAVFSAAQVRIVPASINVRQDMRIFPKEGEDVIVFFPTDYLGYAPKINVVYPIGYEKSQNRYCSVYIINKEELPKEALEKSFLKEDLQRCFFVNIRLNSIPESNALFSFLTRELLPYIETNYNVSDAARDKIFLAGEGYSSPVLNALVPLSAYANNFALSFYVNTAMPADFEGADKNLTLFAVSSLGNTTRLQTSLEKSGFKFFDNFAFAIVNNSAKEQPALKDILNLSYLLSKEGVKPLKAKGAFSAKSASATSEQSFNFWLDVSGKKNFKAQYVPQIVKISPPFLSWKYEDASFSVIYGSQAGKVKISGFAGDVLSFNESFKITE